MTQAYSRLQNRVLRQKADEPELPDITCEIGYRYLSGAIVRGKYIPGEDQLWEDPYAPLTIAGSRFPHVALVDSADQTRRISSLDLVKTNFIMFAADPTSPWVEAVKAARPDIDAYILNESSTPWTDTVGKLRRVCKLEDGEALLVRPDGFIAWRAEKRDSGHSSALKGILREILGV